MSDCHQNNWRVVVISKLSSFARAGLQMSNSDHIIMITCLFTVRNTIIMSSEEILMEIRRKAVIISSTKVAQHYFMFRLLSTNIKAIVGPWISILYTDWFYAFGRLQKKKKIYSVFLYPVYSSLSSMHL